MIFTNRVHSSALHACYILENLISTATSEFICSDIGHFGVWKPQYRDMIGADQPSTLL